MGPTGWLEGSLSRSRERIRASRGRRGSRRRRDVPMPLSRAKEKLLGRLRNTRMRSREEQVVVEGPRATEEVLDGGADVRFALVTEAWGASPEGRSLVDRLEDRGASVEVVEEDVLERVSDTESPQGVLLVCEEPRFLLSELLDRSSGRFLLLDGIQDPGNVGTLIRAARAFDLDAVVALDGTVDPWNPKAVRAGAGYGFRIPVVKLSWDEAAPRLSEAGVRLLVAEAGGTDVHELVVPPAWALVVGNEGRGVRDEVQRAASATVTVPMPGGAESLNAGVAGAILLHLLTRSAGSGGSR